MKWKSLIDVGSSGITKNAMNNQLTISLSKEEVLLIQKYARISAKSVSAVVKMPTLADDQNDENQVKPEDRNTQR